MTAPALRPAVFLDRDGVINEERHYVHRIEDFRLLTGVPEALARWQSTGHALVIVTNQGGIGLGLYGESDVAMLHAHLRAELGRSGVRLDGIYHCPHHPRSPDPAMRAACDCRKPLPGMLLQASRELGLDLTGSVIVGDKSADVQAGRAAGLRRCYLVRSGHALTPGDEALADAVFDDLLDCAVHVARPSSPGEGVDR